MHPTSSYLPAASIVLAAILSAGCGSSIAPTSPGTGAIEITVATTTRDGGIIDPDGYSLSVDSGASQLIAVDTTMTISDLATGEHLVHLDDMTSNCSVTDNGNPFSVVVSSTSAAPVHFNVICWPLEWDY
jgi:hypothetical protein